MSDSTFIIGVYRADGTICVELVTHTTDREDYEGRCENAGQEFLLLEEITFNPEEIMAGVDKPDDAKPAWELLCRLPDMWATRYSLELLLNALAQKLLEATKTS